MISLGCAKNLVDAEIMLGSLLQAGLEVTNDAAAADVLIVNTCSFIDAAQEESVDTILESGELREAQNRGQALVVSGCLPQRFREELPKLLPEVDAFMGIDQVAQVPSIVRDAVQRRAQKLSQPPVRKGKRNVLSALAKAPPEAPSTATSAPTPTDSTQAPTALVQVTPRPQYVPDYATPRFRLTPSHFAYVKIAEGCNHPCSFCIIPRMRGSHRSRAQQDIVTEAKRLIDEGVKELNLISQDSTYYGLDFRPARTGSIASPDRFRAATQSLPGSHPTLCTLLRELNRVSGQFWLRLLYTHPAHWTDELIETMAGLPKVARYVDMPLQHIHHNMLERMRRETSQEYILDLIARIRAGVPGIALRTTFIVGFPGETEGCFETLVQFIREAKFERLGVFTYSHEEGTRAAQMSGQIPSAVKEERRVQAMAAQREVAQQVAASFVGRTLRVLVDKKANVHDLTRANVSSWEHGFLRSGTAAAPKWRGGYYLARGEADAPDIDGRIYVRGDVPVGDFANVRIIGHTDYDLIAEPDAGATAVQTSAWPASGRAKHGFRTA
ncbi:MAG: 30S ribosomal protein S12 methylthiotransferase RimO [Verrucomicrobiota bacterium]